MGATIPKHIEDMLGGSMLNWKDDVPAGSLQIFLKWLRFAKPRRILEVGTFTGTSALSMLKEGLVLQTATANAAPNAAANADAAASTYIDGDVTIDVIDIWDAQELKSVELASFNMSNVWAVFCKNCVESGMCKKMRAFKGPSSIILPQFIAAGHTYDFIYIDGCHNALDCYADMVLGWALLRPGGVLAVDDFLWNLQDPNPLNRPHDAVLRFLEVFKGRILHFEKGYRVFIMKRE